MAKRLLSCRIMSSSKAAPGRPWERNCWQNVMFILYLDYPPDCSMLRALRQTSSFSTETGQRKTVDKQTLDLWFTDKHSLHAKKLIQWFRKTSRTSSNATILKNRNGQAGDWQVQSIYLRRHYGSGIKSVWIFSGWKDDSMKILLIFPPRRFSLVKSRITLRRH